MAQCTAPRNGHRTASGRASCPACGGSSRSYGGYSSYSPSYPSYSSSSTSTRSNSSSSSSTRRAKWSKTGSTVLYTPTQIQSLTPVREVVESKAASQPDLRDVFLCHAWGDRKEAAKDLNDLLVTSGVKVWFSEKDLALGVPMMRAIDKGLANSRIGLVLVTPAMLERLPKESVADKELSALLAGNQLIPIMHNATYDELRNVSPLLASRSGLDTAEDSMAVIAEKIAELVNIDF